MSEVAVPQKRANTGETVGRVSTVKERIMDLRTLAELLWPKRFMIVFVSLVFGGLAYGLTGFFPVRYATEGLLLIDAPKDQAAAGMDRLTALDLLTSPSLLLRVVSATGIEARSDLVPVVRLPTYLVGNLPPFIVDKLPRSIAGALHRSEGALLPKADRAAAAVGYLETHLLITGEGDSRVLSIKFVAGNAKLAADVVNELMKQYMAADFQAKLDEVVHAQNWLSGQMAVAKANADAADRAVQNFEVSHNLVSSQQESLAALDLNRQLDQLAVAKQDLVQAQIASDMATLGGVETQAVSPLLQTLRQSEAELRQRLAASGASLGVGSPGRLEIEDELQSLRAQIADESAKALSAVTKRVALAQAHVDLAQSDVDKAAAAAARSGEEQLELDRLTATAQTMHATYTELLNRMQDIQLAANQVTGASVVSPATAPMRPESSGTAINVILGLLVGGTLTTGFLLQRHLMNARIRSVMGLSSLTSVPSLGTLPRIGSRRGTMADLALRQPHGAVAETLRALRLTMQHSGRSEVGRVVLVTSADRGEGKTSVASSLALRAAADGVRVLLIEGDLHRPRLADDLEMETVAGGLESALSGECRSVAVLQTHSTTSLHCLFATGTSASAIALLDSKAFSKLIEDARSTYDLIVIDGPPILRVPDSLVLSRFSDRIVLVVRADQTPESMVVEALRRFPADQRMLVGTLLTGASRSRSSIEGFYAGYGDRPGMMPSLSHRRRRLARNAIEPLRAS